MAVYTKDPELCGKIRERIDTWDKYWRLNRNQYNEWMTFVMGDQWREDESKLFERYNKIPLTANKLGALLNHLIGDQRQNTPQIQIFPDDNVPEKTAEVRSALVKNISLNSSAKVIYQNVFMRSVVGGFSAYRIDKDYEHSHSFNQEIIVRDIKDPCRAYWDTSAQNESKTDGMGSGSRTRMSRKMFRSIYGKQIESQIGSSSATEDSTLAFWDDDSITIIDDYHRKYDNINIYQLSDMNKTVIDQYEYKKFDKEKIGKQEYLFYKGELVAIVAKRQTESYKIKHRQIAGDFVLEESDFPSQQLPIIYVDQNSFYDKKGKQITRSFFQDVKDSQRYLNYLFTQSAYLLKVSRYDQFMVSRANVKSPDTEAIWRDPSTQQGALVYDESPNGNRPEQLRPPELSNSLITQYERTLMDIQTGTGMYNAQLGEQGNEVSGAAIDARTKRGSYNTYVPFDALNRSIVTAGQIINEMIPNVYDVERDLVLNMPDRENDRITINKPMDEYGAEIENDMTQGRYKIRLMPGPSYEGQKTEMRESMQMLLQADPELFKLIGDLFVESLPSSNNIELRNRVRTIINPQIIEAGKTGKPLPPQPPQPNPDQIMAELKQQELQMKMQQAKQDAEDKDREFAYKEKELQLKALETHQDMSFQYQKLEAEKEEAAAQLQETLLRYQAELQNIQNKTEIATANNLVKLLTHNSKKSKDELKNG